MIVGKTKGHSCNKMNICLVLAYWLCEKIYMVESCHGNNTMVWVQWQLCNEPHQIFKGRSTNHC